MKERRASTESVDETSSEQDHDPFRDDPEDVACNWGQNCEPKGCQCFARPSCLLVWLCLSSFMQGLVVNGFVNSVLTTLELRYGMSSSESGLIASMYDIGTVLCLIPVTYIGHRYKRSRLISIGLLIMSVGSFVFTIPQFTTDAYSYQSPVSPLCYLSGRTYPDFCNKQTLNNYKFVFWLGQFLHGVGASPLYTLAVAYLDDNLTIQQSGIFLGVYYTISLIGPAVGYLLGGIFLGIYVELGVTPTDLSSSNTSLWVGAWWIGFLISGLLNLFIVIPMFGFPQSFPGSTRIRHERKQETHGNNQAMSSGMHIVARGLFSSIDTLVTNPTFIFLSLCAAAETVLYASLSSFGPKILQILFHMRPRSATVIMGLVVTPSAATGVLAGGLLIRCTKLKVRGLLWVCIAIAAVDTIFALGLLIRCNLQKFAGVNHNYPLTPNQPNLLNASCNSKCNCLESKFMYSPLCGADSIIYYSPCYAGCQLNSTLIDGSRYYANCSCISDSMTAGAANYSAMEGACNDTSCNAFPFLLAMVVVFVFGLFFVSVPILQCTMRVIPGDLKDFGLGLQWIIVRLFGSIPGPIVLGKLIDTTCSLWTGGCGQKGSCNFYNGQSFWVMVLIFVAVLKGLEIMFLILSSALYKPTIIRTEKPVRTQIIKSRK